MTTRTGMARRFAGFVVAEHQKVTVAAPEPWSSHDHMSPFVVPAGDGWFMLLRAVPRPLREDDVTGIVIGAASDDGQSFEVIPEAMLPCGPDDADAGGVEDPTIHTLNASEWLVYYTGISRDRERSSLLSARGDTSRIDKRAASLTAPVREENIKEATLAQASDGSWRLFYEYAVDDASRIGLASGPGPEGPWTMIDHPFDVRHDQWDNWHVSTGPIVTRAGAGPVMFYNGATEDARWRVGWIEFDADYTRIVDRCVEPIIAPVVKDRDEIDIAFAASCVFDGDELWLYYSLADSRLARARIVQVEVSPWAN